MKHWPLALVALVSFLMGYLNPGMALTQLVPLTLGMAILVFTVVYLILLVIQTVFRIDLRLV